MSNSNNNSNNDNNNKNNATLLTLAHSLEKTLPEFKGPLASLSAPESALNSAPGWPPPYQSLSVLLSGLCLEQLASDMRRLNLKQNRVYFNILRGIASSPCCRVYNKSTYIKTDAVW